MSAAPVKIKWEIWVPVVLIFANTLSTCGGKWGDKALEAFTRREAENDSAFRAFAKKRFIDQAAYDSIQARHMLTLRGQMERVIESQEAQADFRKDASDEFKYLRNRADENRNLIMGVYRGGKFSGRSRKAHRDTLSYADSLYFARMHD